MASCASSRVILRFPAVLAGCTCFSNQDVVFTVFLPRTYPANISSFVESEPQPSSVRMHSLKNLLKEARIVHRLRCALRVKFDQGFQCGEAARLLGLTDRQIRRLMRRKPPAVMRSGSILPLTDTRPSPIIRAICPKALFAPY